MKRIEGKRDWKPDAELERLVYKVIGAAIDVHREIGPGFPEAVYDKALRIELALRNIPFAPQYQVPLHYKGHHVGTGQLDFLVSDRLIVELKAVDALAEVHTAQVLRYLQLTKQTLGLLINFHVPVLSEGVERIIRAPD